LIPKGIYWRFVRSVKVVFQLLHESFKRSGPRVLARSFCIGAIVILPEKLWQHQCAIEVSMVLLSACKCRESHRPWQSRMKHAGPLWSAPQILLNRAQVIQHVHWFSMWRIVCIPEPITLIGVPATTGMGRSGNRAKPVAMSREAGEALKDYSSPI
jgi:hypothetical protein